MVHKHDLDGVKAHRIIKKSYYVEFVAESFPKGVSVEFYFYESTHLDLIYHMQSLPYSSLTSALQFGLDEFRGFCRMNKIDPEFIGLEYFECRPPRY